MSWSRYLLAIAIGLAVGMAVGWFSGRRDAEAPRAAVHHHHRAQSVDVRRRRQQRQQSRPSPAPQAPARPPTIRELQQQLLECLFDHPTADGQTACLQAVLQRELRLAGRGWPLPGGGAPTLPFASYAQD